MTLRGVDISHHQNDAGLNLRALLGAVDFVIVKATQGPGYTDPRFATNMAAVRSAGKLRGTYHFAGNTGQVPGDPVQEADHYLEVAGHQSGELLVLDYEPSKPPADPDGWCAAFCAHVRDRTGVVPLVYMSEAVARSRPWTRTRALRPSLWVARYGANTGTKPALTLNTGAWGGYVMWQYTSNGRLPGASGVVDLNEFYGDAATWLALGTASTEDDMFTDDDRKALDWLVDAVNGDTFRHDERKSLLAHNLIHYRDTAGTLVANVAAVAAGGQQDPKALAAAIRSELGDDFARQVLAELGDLASAAADGPPTGS